MLRWAPRWYDVAAQNQGGDRAGSRSAQISFSAPTTAIPAPRQRRPHETAWSATALRRALRPIVAIQMGRSTPPTFWSERELGAIAPGRRADVVVSSDLVGLPIDSSLPAAACCAGRQASRGIAPMPTRRLPAIPSGPAGCQTLRFRRAARPARRMFHANVIGVIENQAPTRALVRCRPACRGGALDITIANDVCHIAVVERHRGNRRGGRTASCGFGYGPHARRQHGGHGQPPHYVVGTSKHPTWRSPSTPRAPVRRRHLCFARGASFPGELPDRRPDVRPRARSSPPRRAHDRRYGAMRLPLKTLLQHSCWALVVIPELRISDVRARRCAASSQNSAARGLTPLPIAACTARTRRQKHRSAQHRMTMPGPRFSGASR